MVRRHRFNKDSLCYAGWRAEPVQRRGVRSADHSADPNTVGASTRVYPDEQNKTLLKGSYSVRLGRLLWVGWSHGHPLRFWLGIGQKTLSWAAVWNGVVIYRGWPLSQTPQPKPQTSSPDSLRQSWEALDNVVVIGLA